MINTIQPVRTNRFQTLRFGSDKKSLETEKRLLASLQADKTHHEGKLSEINRYDTQRTEGESGKVTVMSVLGSTIIGGLIGGPLGAVHGFGWGILAAPVTARLTDEMTSGEETVETPEWTEQNSKVRSLEVKITPIANAIAEADQFVSRWTGSDSKKVLQLPSADRQKLLADLENGTSSPFSEVSKLATARLREIESEKTAQEIQRAYDAAKEQAAAAIRGQEAAAKAAAAEAERKNKAIQSDLDAYRYSAKHGNDIAHRMTAIQNFVNREPEMDSNLRQSTALLTSLLSDPHHEIRHYVVELMDKEPKLRSSLYNAAVEQRDAELQAEAAEQEAAIAQHAAKERLNAIHTRLKTIDIDGSSKKIAGAMIGNPKLASALQPLIFQYKAAIGNKDVTGSGLLLYAQGTPGIGKNKLMGHISHHLLGPNNLITLNVRDFTSAAGIQAELAKHDTKTSPGKVGLAGKMVFFDELHAIDKWPEQEKDKLVDFMCLIFGKTPMQQFDFRDSIGATASNKPISHIEALKTDNGQALVSRIKNLGNKINLNGDMRAHMDEIVDKFDEDSLYLSEYPQLKGLHLDDDAKASFKHHLKEAFPSSEGEVVSGRDVVCELAKRSLDIIHQTNLDNPEKHPISIGSYGLKGEIIAELSPQSSPEEIAAGMRSFYRVQRFFEEKEAKKRDKKD